MNCFTSFLRTAAFSGAVFLGFMAATGSAADVGYYSVSKGVLFEQTNAGLPQIRTGYPFQFQALAVPVSNGLAGANVQWALGIRPLGPRFSGGPFTFTDRHPTLDLLDLYYPNGGFTLNLGTTHDGTRMAALTVSDNYYPGAPTIANFAQAQAVNSSNEFTLLWNGFVGGTTNDFVFAQLDAGTGLVWRTSYVPGAAGALNGTSTSVTIASNTLAPGRAYVGRVVFVKVVGTNVAAYPGVTGAGAYFTQTDFALATMGAGDAMPPLVVSVSPPPGATNVPVNAPFIATFSEPMRAAYSLFVSGSGSLLGSTLAWSPDGLTFVLQPAVPWPANATIGMVLNPSDGQMLFSDANRNPLPMETVFQFTTGTNIVPPAIPVLSEARRIITGRFQFKLLGESNRLYAAEASTNLVNWVSLGTNIAWGGSIQYLDTNAPNLPYRFYRGLAPY